MKLLLAALLGAIAMFAWEFVAHMFTPLGEAGIDYMPNVEAVSSSLDSAIGAKRGMYVFPTGGVTADSPKEDKQKAMERMAEEMKTKPSGLLVYKPAGTVFNFGKCLAVQFATDFAKAFLVVWLLAMARLATYAGRLGFVFVAGLLAAIVTNVPYWNWYGFNDTFTAANIIMEIAGFFFAGILIAAVYRPAASNA
jgi:hypothetical protein